MRQATAHHSNATTLREPKADKSQPSDKCAKTVCNREWGIASRVRSGILFSSKATIDILFDQLKVERMPFVGRETAWRRIAVLKCLGNVGGFMISTSALLEATSGPSGIARLDQSPIEFGSLRVFD